MGSMGLNFMDVIPYICLLLASPGTPEPPPSNAEFYTIAEGVRVVAIAWEVMDEREKLRFFSDPVAYQKDLDELRGRVRLLQDAPRIADVYRFPDKYQIRGMIELNRQKKREYAARMELELDRADVLQNAIHDLDARYRILDACRDAQCGDYYTFTRRICLEKVRCYLDDSEWAAGVLPWPTAD